MFRRRTPALFAAALVTLAGTSAVNAQGYTTRIETRPFYGAVVTLEEGVRVFRPLPVERQVIINPGGKTPLSLDFQETNIYEHRVVHNYNHNGDTGVYRGYGVRGGGAYGFVPHYSRANHGRRLDKRGVSGVSPFHGKGQN